MKSDLTNWLLTLILAVFAVACVILSLQTIFLTREFRSLSLQASIANNSLLQVRSLANDAGLYNQKSPNPELTKILRLSQAAPPPAKTHFTAMNEPQIHAEISDQIAALRLQLFTHCSGWSWSAPRLRVTSICNNGSRAGILRPSGRRPSWSSRILTRTARPSQLCPATHQLWPGAPGFPAAGLEEIWHHTANAQSS